MYYSDKLNKLFAVVQEFDDDDISSSVGVYSLAFPPISHASLSAYKPHSRNSEFTFQILIALLILLVIVIISALIFLSDVVPMRNKEQMIKNCYKSSKCKMFYFFGTKFSKS